jgi:hypothetical protein
MSKSIKKPIVTFARRGWQGTLKEQRKQYNKRARADIKLQLRYTDDPFVPKNADQQVFKTYIHVPAYLDEFVEKVTRK